MLSFNDIFKSGFLSRAGDASAGGTSLIAAIALILVYAALIRVVYRKTYRGVMYSKTFGTALSLAIIVTGFVIMTISSNVILSLGMVGALSIVRFRTAVKDAMDVTYMFWAVGLGIATGAGLFLLSFALFATVTVFLFITAREKLFSQPYLFVFSCIDDEGERTAMKIIEGSARKATLRGKTVTAQKREFTVEVLLKSDKDTSFVTRVASIAGVDSASLIGCDGDVSV